MQHTYVLVVSQNGLAQELLKLLKRLACGISLGPADCLPKQLKNFSNHTFSISGELLLIAKSLGPGDQIRSIWHPYLHHFSAN